MNNIAAGGRKPPNCVYAGDRSKFVYLNAPPAERVMKWRAVRLGAVVVIQETGHGCKQEWWVADRPEEVDTRDVQETESVKPGGLFR